ncbi:hypothetical protein L226DRAFT_154938 [Lentinus tigrinus ALCF2SS1-7]|uniref:uncharacterized protein n=1 Tax=Lentinus tigrinus ALCF2SS1-7 TaxID=1328758 RepID=UPI0011660310|nr:hypothetical protein L226DRAFT_154938 [Lentinus tigrinus ALCF2SS1-7]
MEGDCGSAAPAPAPCDEPLKWPLLRLLCGDIEDLHQVVQKRRATVHTVLMRLPLWEPMDEGILREVVSVTQPVKCCVRVSAKDFDALLHYFRQCRGDDHNGLHRLRTLAVIVVPPEEEVPHAAEEGPGLRDSTASWDAILRRDSALLKQRVIDAIREGGREEVKVHVGFGYHVESALRSCL